MGLVADALQRVERGRSLIEHEGVQAVGLVNLFGLLGEPDGRNVVESEVLQHLERDVELAASTVDQDEVRQHAPLLERLRESPREHLAHRGEVVGAGHRADLESLVVVLLEAAVLPDDHRADLLGSLDVGDVVALDAIGQPRQAERALELLEDELLSVVAREQAVLESDGGVGLGHRDELPLGAALGCQHLDAAAAAEGGEPFGGQLGLRQLLGEQDLRRRRHRLAVELADERGEDLAVAPPGDPVEEERLLPDQPALAHEEQLDAGVAALADDADHVLVHVVRRDDLLALRTLLRDWI
jgi:hypothetical protein